MKMILAVIAHEDAKTVLDRLTRRGYAATAVNSTGGFGHGNNMTIFCGVEEADTDEVLAILRESCPSRTQYVTPLPPVMEPGEVHIPTPVEKHLGGATIFVLDVDRFEQI
jgi:uncharacterized protein YaaQ